MKRVVGLVVAAILVGSLAPSGVVAQGSIFVGAGPTFPIGDFGTYAKTGWLGYAGFGVPVGGKGLTAGANLVFGSNKHSGIAGGKTNLFGGFGYLQYRVGNPAKPGVYFYGQVGVLNHKYKPAGTSASSQDDWKPAFGGGAGIDIPLGGVGLFIEGSLIARSGTALIPLMAGLSVPFGRKN